MSSSRVKPGDVLGDKYRVEKVLGAGGMGIVVAAKHLDLNQRVALKFMLREAMADSAHAERFLREAKAAVQLKSIHTARVLDVGKLQNGEPFMVMEYLEGHDLDAEMQQRGPLPPHVAVEYVLQASEALAEAHGLGMVHRDVKLKNLFLTKTVDGRPLVKVLDFGLAKQIGGGNGDVSLTATNSVFGSPQYMSPEQMRSAKDVDYRSDIWSLGVCLYELLTGRVPFDASGVAEICAMVLKDPVPRPSQHVFGLPLDLEAVIMRCLEKDLNRRYQSIAEVAFALQGYASDEGSARRILTVMQQSAQKVDMPTLVTGEPQMEGTGKTLNAWDSGSPQVRRTTSLSKGQLLLVAGLMVSIVFGATGLGLLVLVKRRPTTGSAPTATAVVEPPAEPPPPETALPPPVEAPPPPEPTAAAEPPVEPPPVEPPVEPPPKPPSAVAAPPVVRPPPARPPAPAPPPAPATSTKKVPKTPEGSNYM
ncbi:MAG: serine/threonine protein kinase [Labilithrix sp.]|nr:serine/threonine protein kinase [Labilithrix sp.]MCW5814497.1 serine/threonine protein kinase [Labilithrix sp.]